LIRNVFVGMHILYVASVRWGAYYEGIMWYLHVGISVMIMATLIGYNIMVIDQFEYKKKKYLQYWLWSECLRPCACKWHIHSTANIVSASFCIKTDQ
jgi:hypothetical protein